jgi:hypothetical protein
MPCSSRKLTPPFNEELSARASVVNPNPCLEENAEVAILRAKAGLR